MCANCINSQFRIQFNCINSHFDEYLQSNLSCREIAEKYNIPNSLIFYYIKKYDNCKNVSQTNETKHKDDKQFENLYIEMKNSMKI